jgi:hypothetical protein
MPLKLDGGCLLLDILLSSLMPNKAQDCTPQQPQSPGLQRTLQA